MLLISFSKWRGKLILSHQIKGDRNMKNNNISKKDWSEEFIATRHLSEAFILAVKFLTEDDDSDEAKNLMAAAKKYTGKMLFDVLHNNWNP